MSKVVTIPCCMSPFEVTINGVPYKYAAGSVVEVPDEVAAVIDNHMNQHKEPEKEPEGSTDSACSCLPIMVVNFEPGETYHVSVYHLGSDPEGIPDEQLTMKTYRADKSEDEIKSALESGTLIYGFIRTADEKRQLCSAFVGTNDNLDQVVGIGNIKRVCISNYLDPDGDIYYTDMPLDDPYLWCDEPVINEL